MDRNKVLSIVDHTLLSQSATWSDICLVLDDAIKFGCASACIPPSYVKDAVKYVEGRLPICTVIGFPNGYATTEVKLYETEDAIENGAAEIDMVINIGNVKGKKYLDVENEIIKVRKVCGGKILKVIVEACLLSRDEKIKMCEVVTNSGAEYIKTSTGFSIAGATLEDVELIKRHVGNNVKVKASGGISSFEDAERFIRVGSDRIGTSRLVKIAKGCGNREED